MKKEEPKIKVFCYLDNALGRDTEIVLPVTYALEKYFNCEVEFLFVWDMLAIKRRKPDVVLLPNLVGQHMYFEIGKYAHQNDIVVLALDSEGNFSTSGSHNYWGYNIDKIFYQEWVTAWSKRTQIFLSELAEENKNKIILTGGTGFDRYQVSTFMTKTTFLEKYNLKKYDKIIGYAGWAFGKIHGKHKKSSLTSIHKDWRKRFEWVESNRLMVKGVLKELIKKNHETLFIFKRHPKESFEDEIHEGSNEMNELLGYPNVIYMRNEEMIHDLISISDIWLGFETTTTVEAWLLGKETILINEKIDFPRSPLYKGSLILSNYSDVQDCIDEHYEKGNIEAFYSSKLKEQREKQLANAIGFGDGLNHLRACYHFSKSLKSRDPSKKIKTNLKYLRLFILMNIGKYFFNETLFKWLPGFKKSIYVFKSMHLPGLVERKEQLYSDLDRYYSKNGIDILLESKNWAAIFK